jgi:endonuclease/exonuclease/phosphatase family metal-dependent hydrolase
MPGNDVSGINNGLLVRNDVNVTSVTQLYLNTMTANCSSGTSCLLNDRPPVLMRGSWNGYQFAVLAIYDRSLSGLGDPTKPYIGPKRAEQAAQVASVVQAWQSGATLIGAGNARQNASGNITQGPFNVVGEANVPLIVAGDFNAYQFTDGYVDVTGMIAGTAVQSQNLYWFNGNAADTDTLTYTAPSPTLVDTGIAADPNDRYSFQFDGYVQEIDHILLTRTGWKDFVSVSNAHGNADVSEASPVILDATTPARSGDHDGQVIALAIDRIFANGFEAQP